MIDLGLLRGKRDPARLQSRQVLPNKARDSVTGDSGDPAGRFLDNSMAKDGHDAMSHNSQLWCLSTLDLEVNRTYRDHVKVRRGALVAQEETSV